MTSIADVLISLFAICIGAAIGRIRGGSFRGVVNSTYHGKGFLIVGLAATLILTVLDPGQPMFWMAVAVVGGFGFGLSNLHLTGMIVFLIGLSFNVLVIIANGAMPVSERALRSVGDVDAAGMPVIEGIREAVASAPSLAVLGDIIPVPLFGAVVSIGDLIMMVALGDIATNLYLRARSRPDAAGFRYVPRRGTDVDEDDDIIIDLTDDAPAHAGPAHAADPKVRLTPPLPRVRRPQHAKEPAEALEWDPEAQPPPPTGAPLLAPPPVPHAHSRPRMNPRPTRRPAKTHAAHATPAPPRGEANIDLRDGSTPPKLDLTDRRPIIDLTVSPTDEQLAEFLRRRCEADRRLAEAQLAEPTPGHRRSRLRGRRAGQHTAQQERTDIFQ